MTRPAAQGRWAAFLEHADLRELSDPDAEDELLRSLQAVRDDLQAGPDGTAFVCVTGDALAAQVTTACALARAWAEHRRRPQPGTAVAPAWVRLPPRMRPRDLVDVVAEQLDVPLGRAFSRDEDVREALEDATPLALVIQGVESVRPGRVAATQIPGPLLGAVKRWPTPLVVIDPDPQLHLFTDDVLGQALRAYAWTVTAC